MTNEQVRTGLLLLISIKGIWSKRAGTILSPIRAPIPKCTLCAGPLRWGVSFIAHINTRRNVYSPSSSYWRGFWTRKWRDLIYILKALSMSLPRSIKSLPAVWRMDPWKKSRSKRSSHRVCNHQGDEVSNREMTRGLMRDAGWKWETQDFWLLEWGWGKRRNWDVSWVFEPSIEMGAIPAEPTEMGSMGGIKSAGGTGKLERSVSHPRGLAGGFVRSPVFRGHSSISMNNGLEHSSSTWPHTWMNHFQFLFLVLMPLPEEFLLICPNPYRLLLVIFRH